MLVCAWLGALFNILYNISCINNGSFHSGYLQVDFCLFKLVSFTVFIRNEIVPWQAQVINLVEQNQLAHLLRLKQKVVIMWSLDFLILNLQKALPLLILHQRRERINIYTRIVYWGKTRLWYVIDCYLCFLL